MNTHNISSQIVQCLGNVWAKKMLYDFTVKIGDEAIECHRLILAACSDFFKDLFTSGMREVTENYVVLPDVSCDGFRLVLKCIYTGEDVLTFENLYEFWLVAHRLRINFLLDMTETFAIEAISIDNWDNIYRIAKLLKSGKVLYQIRVFMLKNFDQISLTSTYLQLSFYELRDLLKSEDLNVQNEDVVLEAVMKWVNYVPSVTSELVEDDLCKKKDNTKGKRSMLIHSNVFGSIVDKEFSRKDKLPELLKKIRTCLVSHALLTRVYKMDVVSTNKDSREIIVNAILYHVQKFKHGHWPIAALHRACSGYTHGGILAVDGGNFKFISAHDEKMYTITRSDLLQDCVQFTTVQGELYAIGKQLSSTSGEFNIAVFRENKWNFVMKIKSCNLIFFSRSGLLHIFNRDEQSIYTIPKQKKYITMAERLRDFDKTNYVEHAMSHDNCILLFSSLSLDDTKRTAVCKIDALDNCWHKRFLDGPSEHLISFRNDNFNYILQKNGCMSLVCLPHYGKDIHFRSLVKLWDLERELYGAFAYKKKLIIFGAKPNPDCPEMKTLLAVPNHFKLVKYWGIEAKCSNIAPVILPTANLSEDNHDSII
ncbi:kelch-like protein 13 [Physella acuta]|uniref:kelch-like protein 13 n=1 Tax=Physella acuta TaxID=109671 RepID=UPI0027DC100F|nr:kelch-like protein 13 [Physella acuta]XP_059170175.1 kelch-like protein 13 [Physella acuta]